MRFCDSTTKVHFIFGSGLRRLLSIFTTIRIRLAGESCRIVFLISLTVIENGPLFFHLIKDYSIWMIPSRNLKDRSNFFRMFNPNSPDTVLWGGRFKHAISTFLRLKPRNWTLGTMMIGTYSVPLAVMISIFLVDLEGSTPIANAMSEGMLVILPLYQRPF